MPSTSSIREDIKKFSPAIFGAGTTRVLVGINDYMFDWTLAPGDSFQAPEAVMCFAPDEDEASVRMHAFVREHIVRGKWKKRERPVLVNNWEGTYFQFTEEKILAMAQTAKELGAELFVLDDGWFGRRDDDRSSLGRLVRLYRKTGRKPCFSCGKDPCAWTFFRDLGGAGK